MHVFVKLAWPQIMTFFYDSYISATKNCIWINADQSDVDPSEDGGYEVDCGGVAIRCRIQPPATSHQPPATSNPAQWWTMLSAVMVLWHLILLEIHRTLFRIMGTFPVSRMTKLLIYHFILSYPEGLKSYRGTGLQCFLDFILVFRSHFALGVKWLIY